jgi:ribonuclease HI
LPERRFLFGVAEQNKGVTVNEAEYHGLISLLNFLQELNLENVYIIGDSQLIINQVRGTSNVIKDTLKALHSEVKVLLSQVDVKELYHAPRELNTPADQLSRIGRTLPERKIFYDEEADFTETDNKSLWDELDNYPKVGEDSVNEDGQDVCFVVTRSKVNIEQDRYIQEDLSSNTSVPEETIEEINEETNNEETAVEDSETDLVFINTEEFSNALLEMQKKWIYSSLLIGLLENNLEGSTFRYSKRMISRATAVIEDYILDEAGLLCRIIRDDFSLVEEQAVRTALVIPPGKLRNKIIYDCHDSTASGHYGIEKTYKRVRRNFYWKGIQKDIKLYCMGCPNCSRTKGDIRKRAQMKNTRIPSRPFEFISLDLVGPFPSSAKKNKYLLVSQCIFSNFIILSPIPDKSAEVVAVSHSCQFLLVTKRCELNPPSAVRVL